ncbi:MAG: STN domain-containing protein [Rudaea sp.]|uniref:STN domain-containing protein n=1 Tax=Rudaea sp. TaxID=2136325 RepID=UPI0039E4E10C
MTGTARSVILFLVLLALSPLAALAQTAAFNLPAQPLAESLKALGAQANINVMVAPALVDGRVAPVLKGDMSTKDALTKLLEGTGLEYHFVNEQTVVVRQKAATKTNTEGANAAAEQKNAGGNSSRPTQAAEEISAQSSSIGKGNDQRAPQKTS